MFEPIIYRCNRRHYFLDTRCPYCGGPVVGVVERRDQDCLACGALCQEGGYCCADPEPLEFGGIDLE